MDTDATPSDPPRGEHGHHPNCYQNTGVPVDLPDDLCDCRVLRMIDAAKDPAPASADTGDRVTLSEDEREALWNSATEHAWRGVTSPPASLYYAVERILSDRLAAVVRERDDFDRGLVAALEQRDEAEASVGRANATTLHEHELRLAAEAEVERLRVRLAAVEALAEQWAEDRAGYPVDDDRASIAYAAVTLCERELRAALASGQAGKGAQGEAGTR